MTKTLSVHARIAIAALLMAMTIVWLSDRTMIDIVLVVVSDNIDASLDAELRLLEMSLDDTGAPDESRIATFHELDAPQPGWGWQVSTSRHTWDRGQRLGRVEFPTPRVHLRDGIFSGRGWSADGMPIHIRRRQATIGNEIATITIISPMSIIDNEVARVQRIATRYLVAVVVVLVLAALLQLRIGLGPLRRLGRDIAHIRSGDLARLPDAQPAELREVAAEVNALIARNKAGLEAARLNAANLAHSVKTPLATLLLELEHLGGSESARALVQDISDRVAHHLTRARSAAIGLGDSARCDVAAVTAEIAGDLGLIHGRSSVVIHNRIEAPCPISVDAHDLTEMLGNLAENACRYAHSRVVMEAHTVDNEVVVTIEDDGDGVPADQLDQIQQPGVRLDSVNDGYGFGLAIVRELAELYGGHLELRNRSEGNGLSARLTLPR